MAIITPQELDALRQMPPSSTSYSKLCERLPPDAAPSPSVVSDQTLLEEFIQEAYVVYLAGHASSIKQLQRSTHVIKYLELLSNPGAFKGDVLLRERLGFALHVLGDSPQRPVVERAAVTLLQLEMQHHWLDTEPQSSEHLFNLTQKKSTHTIPLLALCLGRHAHFEERFAEGLLTLDVTRKKTRLGELIEVVNVLDDEALSARLIDLTYENLFFETPADDKLEMLQRVVRECGEKYMFQYHPERGQRLIDPILAQNITHPIAVVFFAELLASLPSEAYAHYMGEHVRTLARQRQEFPEKLLKHLTEHGKTDLIRFLYPSTQQVERGLFSERLTPYASRVQKVIDTIIEREGVPAKGGQLTLAEGGVGGELTLTHAAHGALSLGASGAHADRAQAEAPRSLALEDEALLPPELSTLSYQKKNRRMGVTVVVTLLLLGVLLYVLFA